MWPEYPCRMLAFSWKMHNNTLMFFKKGLSAYIVALLLLVCFHTTALAVEVAPRISDREIIEALAELKAGQQALNQRFDEQNKSIDKRFEAIDKRFDVVNQRLTTLSNTMLTLFGAIITLIVALFAYIAWDRRTMFKPVSERLERLESEIVHDLQLRHDDGSLLIRLVKVLREQAKNDPKLAAILRNFSLL